MLVVERHDGKLWLVHYKTPSSSEFTLVAQFVSDEAVAIFHAMHNRAMCVAREVGRAGIG